MTAALPPDLFIPKDMTSFEYILMLGRTESASSRASLVNDFIQGRHSLLEFAIFFQWLADELAKGEVEFVNLIWLSLSLDKSKARLLSTWLIKLVA